MGEGLQGSKRKGKTMTALEYMEKQLQKNRQNFIREFDRKAPAEVLENIKLKVGYYEDAVEALRKVGADNGL